MMYSCSLFIGRCDKTGNSQWQTLQGTDSGGANGLPFPVLAHNASQAAVQSHAEQTRLARNRANCAFSFILSHVEAPDIKQNLLRNYSPSDCYDMWQYLVERYDTPMDASLTDEYITQIRRLNIPEHIGYAEDSVHRFGDKIIAVNANGNANPNAGMRDVRRIIAEFGSAWRALVLNKTISKRGPSSTSARANAATALHVSFDAAADVDGALTGCVADALNVTTTEIICDNCRGAGHRRVQCPSTPRQRTFQYVSGLIESARLRANARGRTGGNRPQPRGQQAPFRPFRPNAAAGRRPPPQPTRFDSARVAEEGEDDEYGGAEGEEGDEPPEGAEEEADSAHTIGEMPIAIADDGYFQDEMLAATVEFVPKPKQAQRRPPHSLRCATGRPHLLHCAARPHRRGRHRHRSSSPRCSRAPGPTRTTRVPRHPVVCPAGWGILSGSIPRQLPQPPRRSQRARHRRPLRLLGDLS